MAIHAADKAVANLRLLEGLTDFIQFAQNQTSFSLSIKSEGFLYLLQFLQAHVDPVLNEAIHYTAGVPEWVVKRATDKSSKELSEFVAQEYKVFNARVNFIIALHEISPLVERISSLAYQQTYGINQVVTFFKIFNEYLGEILDSEEAIPFNHADIKLMQAFFTECDSIFQDISDPLSTIVRMICSPALRRLDALKEKLPPESVSAASSSSSFFSSEYSVIASAENIELIRTKHEIITILEKQIKRLADKVEHGFHLKSTREKAKNKTALLNTLILSINTADSEARCQTLIETTLKRPEFEQDLKSTSSIALAHLWEKLSSTERASSSSSASCSFTSE